MIVLPFCVRHRFAVVAAISWLTTHEREYRSRTAILQGIMKSAAVHLRCLNREIQSSPRRKLGRLPACYFVCEGNSVGRIRTQVSMSLEVTKPLCHPGGPRKESSENFRAINGSVHPPYAPLEGRPSRA